MNKKLRYPWNLFVVFLLCLIRLTNGQTTMICQTAVWNNTFRILAGITGTLGSGPTTLYHPFYAEYSLSNTLYVVDDYNSRIMKYVGGSASGTPLSASLSYPTNVHVINDSLIYILDDGNRRVLRWNNGVSTVVAGGNGNGAGNNQQGSCLSMFMDSNFNIYISDSTYHRVMLWTYGNTTSGQPVAGNYGAGSAPQQLYTPIGIYVDNSLTIYIADYNNHRIQAWYQGAALGVTIAGQTGVSGGWSYLLSYPSWVFYDQYDYLYILDSGNNRVQRWRPNAPYGTTVIAASMYTPRGLSITRTGDIVITEYDNHRVIIFSMSCPTSTTTTTTTLTPIPTLPMCQTSVWNQTYTILAGSTGNAGSTQALLNNPYSTYMDTYGNIYVADYTNHRIQYFTKGSALGTTVAGVTLNNGGYLAQLNYPSAVYADANRAMYILDTYNCRVLNWQMNDPLGYVVAAGAGCGTAYTQIHYSYSMIVDNQANIYISECQNNRVTYWSSSNMSYGALVAGGFGSGSTPEKLNCPWGIYLDSNQALYIVDRNNHRVQRWDYGFLTGVTVAGTTGSLGPWSYQFSSPTAISLDPFGYLYVLDTGNNRLQRWWPGAAYGTTLISSLNAPVGFQFDLRGNILIADTGNHRVITYAMTCPNLTTTTTIAPPPTIPQASLCPTSVWNQTIQTLAGISGSAAATSILLYNPNNIDFDAYQNLYVADTSNHRIQYFPRGSTTGQTVAGSSGSYGSSFSQLYNPYAIYVDQNNYMFILDTSNYRVLRWKVGYPLGYVVAGGNGNGGAMTQIGTSYAFFVDSNSNIYVSENTNHRVTLWTTTNSSYAILVAGGNGNGNTAEKLSYPWGIYVDSNQAVYVVDRNNHRVQRWDNGAIQGVTVAGSTSNPGVWSYQFSSPTAILMDQYGYLYILDYGNNRIQKWYPGNNYGQTVASTSMNNPCGLQFDLYNNLVVADTANHRIISFAVYCPPTTTTTVAPPTSTSVTICPTAAFNQTFQTLAGISGSRGATSTLLNYPYHLDFDGYQNLFVVDTYNHRIQYYPRGSSTGQTVAGVSSGSAGTGYSELNYPTYIYVDANRFMYILDSSNCRVLKWKLGDPLGYVVAGGYGCSSQLNQIYYGEGIFVDNQGNIYIADWSNHRIVLWLYNNQTSGILVAGGNGAGSTPSQLNNPNSIYVDVNGSMFIVDRGNHRVQLWLPGSLAGTTIAGSTGNPGPYAYQLNTPTGIIMDPYGYIYVLDSGNNRVQKWYPGGSYGITIISGSLNSPYGFNFDLLGNLVIADTYNSRIISFALTCPPTTTTTVAPPTTPTVPICPTAVWNQTYITLAGSFNNPGATSTLLNRPFDLGFDGYNNMYIVDTNNHRIQQFPSGSNVGTTVAGVTGSYGSSRSQFNSPQALYVTDNGTIFVIDVSNFRVMRWNPGDPMGTLVAGGNGNGGAFNQISYSYAIIVDNQYNMYISESGNNRITKWFASNTTAGILVAGGNGAGSTMDKLNNPWGIVVTNTSIYIADSNNHRIQRWDFGAALAVTIAGTTGSPGPWSYQLNNPTAIAFDPYGYLYIMDWANNRVQKWYPGSNYGVTVAATTLYNPYRMKLDRLGNIVICDTDYHRVIKFTMTCPPSTTTTTPPPTQAAIPLCPTAQFNQTFQTLAGSAGSAGSTSTLLNTPYDLDFDGYGNMFVVDRTNNRIQRFPQGSNAGSTAAGYTLGSGSSRSELYWPSAITIYQNQYMFILDTYNNRVLQWKIGDLLGYIIAGGNGAGAAFNQMYYCYGMFVDSNGNVYLSEQGNHRVVLWYNGNTTAGTLVAGGNGAGSSMDKLNSPWGVYVNVNGSIFVVDRGNHRIQNWDQGASLGSTVAGSTNDAGPYAYQFNSPTTMTMDPYGYMYILDYGNSRLQRWWPGASYGITMISGSLNSPVGMRIDRQGNMVIADTSNHRIVSFSMYCPSTTTTTTPPPTPAAVPLCATATWNQSFTIVGGATSNPGSTTTLLNYPQDVTFDAYNNMYVADNNNHRIQRFSPGSSIGQTVAGVTSTAAGSRSTLNYPTAILVTNNMTMFILDASNYRVLRWKLGDPLGYVAAGGNGNGGAFTQIGTSYQFFVDSNSNVYVSESSNNRVTLWTTYNSSYGLLIAGGNGVGNTPEKLSSPWGIYLDSTNGLYIVDRSNHRVQYWPAGASAGTTVAGSTSDPGPWSYQFNSPTAITMDIFGYIYVLDYSNKRVQRWFPGANFGITVISANLYNPMGMSLDNLGNFYIADTYYHRVIKFSLTCPPPTTTTVAPPTQPLVSLCPTAAFNATPQIIAGSTSSPGSTATLLYYPYDIDYDAYGSLYIVDYNNHRIQKYPQGVYTGQTIAGSTSSPGSSRSQFTYPTSIRVSANGTMFILDDGNYRILKWQVGDTLGYVVAGGNGNGAGFNQIGDSYSLFVDTDFNIYVSERSNHRVTLWFNGNTTAGTLVAGGNGLGNTNDKLNYPWGVYVDVNGTIYVSDRGNHRIQKWSSGINGGLTVAGSNSDPGSWSYQLNNPTAVTLDPFGYIYILDYSNNRVQKWWPGGSYGTTVVSGSMNLPMGLKFDRNENLIVADTSNHRIISFALTCPSSTSTSTLPPTLSAIPLCQTAVWNTSWTMIAGATANAGSTSTLLYNPYDIKFDLYGFYYVADFSNNRIQRFRLGSNLGTTVAGFNPSSGGGRSELYYPSSVFIDQSQNLFILDTNNYRVMKWKVGEPIGIVVVNGRGQGSSFTQIGSSYSFFIDQQLDIYVSEYGNNRVTLWFNGNNTASTLIAGGNGAGNTPEKLNSPWGIAIDSTNTGIYIVDKGNHRVQYWLFGGSAGSTVAGSTSDPGSWSYQFSSPSSILLDQFGYLYITDTGNNRIQKWYPGAPYGTTLMSSSMNGPIGFGFDLSNNFYVADTSNHRILSFSLLCPPTTTTTVAPPTISSISICSTAVWNSTSQLLAGITSSPGSTSTLLNSPYDIAFDAYKNLYVADTSNHRIQFFRPGSSTGQTVAGNSGSLGYGRSELYSPMGIYVTSNSTMYILDTSNYRVLRWQLNDPLGYVVVNGRGQGSSFTQIGTSYSFFIDQQFNIYVSEYGNNRVTLWFNGNNTASTLVAGGNGVGTTNDKLNGPWGIYVNSNQSVYVVDSNNHRVQRWDQGANAGVTVAGSPSDPGVWSYQLNSPTSIVFDPYGYLYVLDTGNTRIQKWFPGGAYGTTILSGSMSSPASIKFDPLSNMVIADRAYHRVISYSLTCPLTTSTTTLPSTISSIPLCSTAIWNSTSTIVAGSTGTAGSTSTLLNTPYDVAFDSYKYMYVVDYNNHRVQRYRPGSNTGTTVAGNSGAPGTSRSELYYPVAISVTGNATMFILEYTNCRVMRWQVNDPLGYIVVNGRGCGTTFNNIGNSYSLFVDQSFNIYVSEYSNHRVTKWSYGNNTASSLIAGGNGAGVTPEKLSYPWGIYVDSNGNLYVSDRGNHRIQQWNLGAANGQTVAGDTNGNAGPFSYQLSSPTTIMFDIYGYLYILDQGNNRIQKWLLGATFGTTVLSSTFSNPIGMRLDQLGNVYIADSGYHRIQSFSVYCPPTTTSTIAPPTQTRLPLCSTSVWNSTSALIVGATGTSGSSSTFLSSPYDLTFDKYQNLYVADYGNQRIQQYSYGSNVGVTVAGITGSSGSTLAQLSSPASIYVDQNNLMYILDASNYRVLKWQVGDQLGNVVVNGRGIGTTLDRIGLSYSMCFDNQNNVFVSENGNHRVTKWSLSNNTVGQLVAGGSGSGNSAEKLNGPWGVYVDSSNSLFVVDRGNHRVQKWVIGSAFGITVAGDSGNPGVWSYQLNNPTGITFDIYGAMYILDQGNNRIQKWIIGSTFGITVVSATLSSPNSFTWDFSNNFYIADTANHRIVSFNLLCPPTTTTTLAFPTLPANLACQTGVFNATWSVAAGQTATSGSSATLLYSPTDVFIDGDFFIYVADTANNRIQKFKTGVLSGSTVAGLSLTAGTSAAQFNAPTSIFVDLNGVMYIADSLNYRIQKWYPNQPLGSTVAGGRGNGTTLDKLGLVYGIFVDSTGNIYVSESSNHRVTLWYSFNTTAGELVAGGMGMGNSSFHLNSPYGVYVDLNFTLYVVDRGNHRIQQWIEGYNFGNTVAGSTGISGSSSSLLNSPTTITFDTNFYMFVMDAGNNRIQRFAPGSLVADTIAATTFSSPKGMRLDSIGNLYVSDQNNHRIVFYRCVYNASTTTITTVTTTTGPTTSTTTVTTSSTTTVTTTSTSSTTTTTATTTSTSSTATTTVTTPSTTSTITITTTNPATTTTVPTTTQLTTTGASSSTTSVSTTTVASTTVTSSSSSTATVATTTGASSSTASVSTTTVASTTVTSSSSSTATVATTTGASSSTASVSTTTVASTTVTSSSSSTATVATTTGASSSTTSASTTAVVSTIVTSSASSATTVAITTGASSSTTSVSTTTVASTIVTSSSSTTIIVVTTTPSATTTTVVTASTSTTTAIGATTTAAPVTTTTAAGATTTAAPVATTAAATTTAAGATTSAGSVGTTSDAGASGGSSQGSSNIGVIAGGAAGGVAALAGLAFGGYWLAKRLKRVKSSSSSTEVTSIKGKNFTKVENLSSSRQSPITPENTNPRSNSKGLLSSKVNPSTATNNETPSEPLPTLDATHPAKLNVNSRTYNIHVIH